MKMNFEKWMLSNQIPVILCVLNTRRYLVYYAIYIIFKKRTQAD